MRAYVIRNSNILIAIFFYKPEYQLANSGYTSEILLAFACKRQIKIPMRCYNSVRLPHLLKQLVGKDLWRGKAIA